MAKLSLRNLGPFPDMISSPLSLRPGVHWPAVKVVNAVLSHSRKARHPKRTANVKSRMKRVRIGLLKKSVYLHDICVALADGSKHPFSVR